MEIVVGDDVLHGMVPPLVGLSVGHATADAAAEAGLPDWQTYLLTADTSLAQSPQSIGECLADITEAAGRRKAAEIYDKGKAGEISVAEAMEALEERRRFLSNQAPMEDG